MGLFLLSYGDLDRQKEGIDGQKLVLNSYPRQDFQKRGTICRKLAQFNTQLEVNPKNWQAKTGKVSGRGAEFTRINEMLDGIKATLYKHYDHTGKGRLCYRRKGTQHLFR